jgi:hypothetical protein
VCRYVSVITHVNNTRLVSLGGKNMVSSSKIIIHEQVQIWGLKWKVLNIKVDGT